MEFSDSAAVEQRALKKALFDAYDGFADKRLKNLDRGNAFIIDGRTPGDHDARGKLYSWFCQMFSEVIDPIRVKVTLRGGVPNGATLRGWIEKHKADETETSLTFYVSPSDTKKLTELAKALRAIIRRPYPVKAYKFVVPRTAACLDHLAKILSDHWQSKGKALE